jgi:tRNA pseudouridine38-40 synthase
VASITNQDKLLPRYKLILEYDGTPFVGWQIQTNGCSVQQVVEEALARLVQHTVPTQCAGRTDSGVHAHHQVVHIDLENPIDPFRLQEGLNAHLRPHPISVLSAKITEATFEARFSARYRRYCYRILNRRAPPTFQRNYVWHIPHPLDISAMESGGAILVGHHDFTTFRASTCQANSPIRTLERLDVQSMEDDVIHIVAQARSFLHRQVRSMVGGLVKIGLGKLSVSDLESALLARDRHACPPIAPPHGLYLDYVSY